MFSLVYRSKAKVDFNSIAIEKMLEKARKSNEKVNITGCLLYHNGYFIQLIEGEETQVKSLFNVIKNDGRHESILVLSMEESVSRIFGDWHMISEQLSGQGDNQNLKRQLFDDIFHSSEAVSTPGNSKLALWIQVNKLLSNETSQSEIYGRKNFKQR